MKSPGILFLHEGSHPVHVCIRSQLLWTFFSVFMNNLLIHFQGYSWPITRWGLFQGKWHFSRDFDTLPYTFILKKGPCSDLNGPFWKTMRLFSTGLLPGISLHFIRVHITLKNGCVPLFLMCTRYTLDLKLQCVWTSKPYVQTQYTSLSPLLKSNYFYSNDFW